MKKLAITGGSGEPIGMPSVHQDILEEAQDILLKI
jgi:hypothetical protein